MLSGAQDVLQRLLARASAEGWRHAVDRECGGEGELHRYATDPREGDCLYFLPGIPRRRALFLGNSLAILPLLLAEHFESVVTADWNADRLTFAEHRRREERAGNVRCVSADAVADMVTRDGPFDVLVLGEENPEAPLSVPFADLHTAARLSPLVAVGGCLIYGTRFRLSLPAITRLFRAGTDGVASSYAAHARLLAAAGFSAVTAHWRRPHHRPYHAYIPLDDPLILRYWLHQSSTPHHIRPRVTAAMSAAATRLGVLRHIVDNVLVIARRP